LERELPPRLRLGFANNASVERQLNNGRRNAIAGAVVDHLAVDVASDA
jgi:hypothetical protein